jgi:hypothetical protein
VGEAATIATLSMMTCAGKKTWGSNTGPQRLVVSVFYDLGPGAAVLGNVGLALLCYAAQRSALHVLNSAPSGQDAPSAVEAHLRYPSVSWAVFLFLLPGTFFSSVSLLATDDDAVFGASAAGRAAAGAVSMVLASSLTVYLVYTVVTATWKRLRIANTSDILCEPHLPRWFLQLSGSWLLPRVMWEPKNLKLRYGAFFSSVASTDALWAHSLLQVHGAVFSLIAAIPFPEAACVVQFVLAIAWMCVPIALVLWWRLRLLRRPPSNLLSLLSSAIIIGVLLATAVYVEGPMSSREAAASARDALGVALTVVSVVKTVLNVVCMVAEGYAGRNYDATSSDALGATRHGRRRSDRGGKTVTAWLRKQQLVSSNSDKTTLTGEDASNVTTLNDLSLLEDPSAAQVSLSLIAQPEAALGGMERRHSRHRALNIAALDAQIDHMLNHTCCATLMQFMEDGEPYSLPAQRVRERAHRFALKLLVTRAARGAEVLEGS